MTGLVIGDHLLFLRRHQAAAAFGATHADAFDRLLQFTHADGTPVAPCCQNRRLIDDILQVSADKTGRLAGDLLEVDGWFDRLAFDMHLQNRATANDIGAIHCDPTVEATGTQQRRV